VPAVRAAPTRPAALIFFLLVLVTGLRKDEKGKINK
jgi:hypothetical protein